MEFLKRWWVVLAVLVLILLVVVERFLLGKSDPKFLWINLYLAVAPNLIADLLTILVGYGIFRLTAKDHYVETMIAVRTAVQNIPGEHELQPLQVQALMAGVVPIVAKLYFKGGKPTSKLAKEDKLYTTTCRSCTQSCNVKNGRCGEKCFDIPESWAGQELTEVTQIPDKQ